MGVFFSLPFIGLVLGWFFVGAFISAPTSVEMMGSVSGYRISLILSVILGLILMAVAAKVEWRLREQRAGAGSHFLISFMSIVIGFCLGFALPFLTLLMFAEPPV